MDYTMKKLAAAMFIAGLSLAGTAQAQTAEDVKVGFAGPMTGAQASYLKTLSEECGEPDSFQADLTKAEASKRIDALKSKRRPVQHR